MNGNTTYVENARIILVKGDTGSSIQSIEKTSSSGAVDTYTVTLTDGTTSTFQVTNGAPLRSIELTSSTDVYDIYTVTDSAGNTVTFQVRNHVKDIQDFEDEVNDLLSDTPYLVYDEDAVPELPVNTINDNVTATDSTWSSTKISEEVSESITEALAVNDWVYLGTAFGTGASITVPADANAKEICVQLMYSQKSILIVVPTIVLTKGSIPSYYFFQNGGIAFDGEIYITTRLSGDKPYYKVDIADCKSGSTVVSSSVHMWVYCK